MIAKGTKVRATLEWGYGSEVVSGQIDRDYLEGFDSNQSLTIWTPTGNYTAVIIDARWWKVEKA